MANRIESFTVTVPAGTAVNGPLSTDLAFTDGTVEIIEIKVPSGSAGLVGFYLAHSGQQIIPYQSGNWIVSDDENIRWEVDHYPTGGKWSVVGYNSDVFDHSLYLRFLISDYTSDTPSRVTLVPVG